MRTIEIGEALKATTGEQWYSATLHTNRKYAKGGGLTKGQKVATIYGDKLEDLLRNVASLIEQETNLDPELDPLETLEDILEGRL